MNHDSACVARALRNSRGILYLRELKSQLQQYLRKQVNSREVLGGECTVAQHNLTHALGNMISCTSTPSLPHSVVSKGILTQLSTLLTPNTDRAALHHLPAV